jgi:hypothetical protein
MKNFFFGLAFVAGVTIGPSISSSEVSGQDCINLASIIASGDVINFSNTDFQALNYYALCESSAKSNKFGLNVTIAGYGLGFSSDSANQDQFCLKKKEEYKIDQTTLFKAKQVFDKAFPVIEACLAAANKGWVVKYQQVQKDALSFNISNLNPTGGNLIDVDLIAPDSIACKGMPSTFPRLVTSDQPVSMLCTRKTTTQVLDGVTMVSAPEVTVNLRLDDNQIPVRMAGYSSSALARIEAWIASVEKKTDGVTSALQQTKSSLLGWPEAETAANVITAPNDTMKLTGCPAGEYVSGVSVSGNTAKGQCQGCLNRIRVMCRKLNVNQ